MSEVRNKKVDVTVENDDSVEMTESEKRIAEQTAYRDSLRKRKPRKDKEVTADKNEMGRYIRHALWSYYAEPIDISDAAQVEQRINDYFNHCLEDGMKPSVMGICNSLGISRDTFHQWCTGSARALSHTDVIKKAKNFLEEMMESYMLNGKINPVSGIFLLKNNFGYTDKQEVVLKPDNSLGDVTDPAELQQKYIEAASDVVKDCDFSVDSDD